MSEKRLHRGDHANVRTTFHVQRVHVLQSVDPRRVQFCERLVQKHENDGNFTKTILAIDEIISTRNGINNCRNIHVWFIDNPHGFRSTSFQSLPSNSVWTGFVNDIPMGPHILLHRLTGENCSNLLYNDFSILLDMMLLQISALQKGSTVVLGQHFSK